MKVISQSSGETVVSALYLLIHRNSLGLTIRSSGFLVVALFLTGCAIGHTRVDLSTIEAPPPNKAKIFVIRPKYDFGSAIDLSVTANDTKIVDLYNLSYTSFLVHPGKLKLSGDGRASAWPHKEVIIDIAEGQNYYIAWSLVEGHGLWLVPLASFAVSSSTIHWEILTKAQAQELLNSTNYVAPIAEEIP